MNLITPNYFAGFNQLSRFEGNWAGPAIAGAPGPYGAGVGLTG
jgi:hypothetical protein